MEGGERTYVHHAVRWQNGAVAQAYLCYLYYFVLSYISRIVFLANVAPALVENLHLFAHQDLTQKQR